MEFRGIHDARGDRAVQVMGHDPFSYQEGRMEVETARMTMRQRRIRLRKLVRELCTGRTLVVASNRGPVTFERSGSGRVRRRRGTGGVVSAVSAVSRYVNPVWICSPMSTVDREMAEQNQGGLMTCSTADYSFQLRFVMPDQTRYDEYYSTVSNPLLWFLQHYMWDLARTPTFTPEMWSAWGGYREVNEAFADAIAEEVENTLEPAIVMLQDYHLYLCPGALASRLPEGSLVSQFIHIPWPGPDYWMVLPASIREQILSSLCSNSILGFQTRRWALNFLRTCQSLLPGAEVDYASQTVRWRHRSILVRSYPISIDVTAVRRLGRSLGTRAHREHLVPRLGEQTVVRVDRIEPSKNIVRGFEAFDLLLERHPEHVGHLRLVAFLVPSRLGIDEYQQYLEEIVVLVQHINLKYGDGEWQPIKLYVGENYARAVAGMQLHDVLLVNPIVDGMNLVAKEGAVLNERDGVLVLSEGAGASEELGEAALVVCPYDVVETAEKLHRALTMSPEERAKRAAMLREVVEGHTVTDWLYSQLVDLSVVGSRDVGNGQGRGAREAGHTGAPVNGTLVTRAYGRGE
jgi:trehalose 6-phosphate synthase